MIGGIVNKLNNKQQITYSSLTGNFQGGCVWMFSGHNYRAKDALDAGSLNLNPGGIKKVIMRNGSYVSASSVSIVSQSHLVMCCMWRLKVKHLTSSNPDFWVAKSGCLLRVRLAQLHGV